MPPRTACKKEQRYCYCDCDCDCDCCSYLYSYSYSYCFCDCYLLLLDDCCDYTTVGSLLKKSLPKKIETLNQPGDIWKKGQGLLRHIRGY